MISKELLSEVAPEYSFCDEITIDENEFVFWKDGEMYSDINIYELAHKCKEWALTKGCILNSCEYMKDASCEAKHPFCEDEIFGEYKDFEADTEPEAIFLACEWILKESK